MAAAFLFVVAGLGLMTAALLPDQFLPFPDFVGYSGGLVWSLRS